MFAATQIAAIALNLMNTYTYLDLSQDLAHRVFGSDVLAHRGGGESDVIRYRNFGEETTRQRVD